MFKFVGAGIRGFTRTFALISVWGAGTCVAAAYGHLALPGIRNVKRFNQRLGVLSFWLLFLGIGGIAFSYALGATVQIVIYRFFGFDWCCADLQSAMSVGKALVPVFGLTFITGAGSAATTSPPLAGVAPPS